jgi:hypothetical protein
MLFFSKVGKHTLDEFNVAHKQFKKTGQPIIFTYFKNASIDSIKINEHDLTSMVAFKKKLQRIGHYFTTYDTADGLKYHFTEQLDKLNITSSGTISDNSTNHNQYQKPVPATFLGLRKRTLGYAAGCVILLLLGFIVLSTYFWNDNEIPDSRKRENTNVDGTTDQQFLDSLATISTNTSVFEEETTNTVIPLETKTPSLSTIKKTNSNSTLAVNEAPTIAPISFNTGSNKISLIYHSHALARKDTFDIDLNKTVEFLKTAIKRHYKITIPKEFLGNTDENITIEDQLVANHKELYAVEKKLSEMDLQDYDIIEFDYRRISSVNGISFIKNVLVIVEGATDPNSVMRIDAQITSSQTTVEDTSTQFYFEYLRDANPNEWIAKLAVFDKSYFLTQPISEEYGDTLRVTYKLLE